MPISYIPYIMNNRIHKLYMMNMIVVSICDWGKNEQLHTDVIDREDDLFYVIIFLGSCVCIILALKSEIIIIFSSITKTQMSS